MSREHKALQSEQPAPVRHDVCFSPGGFHFKAEFGIELTADEIRWGDQALKYADLASIRLQSLPLKKSPDGALCVLTDRFGRTATFTGQNPFGLYDPEFAERYRSFLRDLHARLAPYAANIRFTRGIGETRHNVVFVGLVALASMLVVFPIALALFTGHLQALWVSLAGIALVWPLWRNNAENTPDDYDPAAIPEELMPG